MTNKRNNYGDIDHSHIDSYISKFIKRGIYNLTNLYSHENMFMKIAHLRGSFTMHNSYSYSHRNHDKGYSNNLQLIYHVVFI